MGSHCAVKGCRTPLSTDASNPNPYYASLPLQDVFMTTTAIDGLIISHSKSQRSGSLDILSKSI